MRVLLVGSAGFVGSHVYTAMAAHHTVIKTSESRTSFDAHFMDLLDHGSITTALNDIQPDIIISCAGVVADIKDVSINETFTLNLLKAVSASGLNFRKIIIMGSAAEYGEVNPEDLPLSEDAHIRAVSGYGLSKAKEVSSAIRFSGERHLPLVAARIFNPIGPGMNPKSLIPRLLDQIAEIQAGHRDIIEVSRLDSKRDYLSITDVASGIMALAEHPTKHLVYNLGSGRATSNGELVQLMLKESQLPQNQQVVETSPKPETPVASQADISRITLELGWRPQISIEQTIKEIVNAKR